MLNLSAIGCGCIFHDGASGRRKGRTGSSSASSDNARAAETLRHKREKPRRAFFPVHLPMSERKALFLPTRKVVNSDFMFSAYSWLLSSELLSMVKGMCHSEVLQIVALLRTYVAR